MTVNSNYIFSRNFYHHRHEPANVHCRKKDSPTDIQTLRAYIGGTYPVHSTRREKMPMSNKNWTCVTLIQKLKIDKACIALLAQTKGYNKGALTYRKSHVPKYKKCDMRSCALSRLPLFSYPIVLFFCGPLKQRNLRAASDGIMDGGVDRNNKQSVQKESDSVVKMNASKNNVISLTKKKHSMAFLCYR